MDGHCAWQYQQWQEREGDADAALTLWLERALAQRFSHIVSEPVPDCLTDLLPDPGKSVLLRNE
jgi:hypothetical protein